MSHSPSHTGDAKDHGSIIVFSAPIYVTAIIGGQGRQSYKITACVPSDEDSRQRMDEPLCGIYDSLELQTALDELNVDGSPEALRLFLADKGGFDRAKVALRVEPVELDEKLKSSFRYMGKLDSLDEVGPRQEPAFVTRRGLKQQEVNMMPTGGRESTYKYQNLDTGNAEIRLLRLECGDNSEVLDQLQLESYPLNKAPDYFCISYVWGKADLPVPLKVNGKLLRVTSNLYQALVATFIRYPNGYLWADGICINQNDLEERARQVRLMGKIFERCQKVLANPGHYAYLGDPNADGGHHERRDASESTLQQLPSETTSVTEDKTASTSETPGPLEPEKVRRAVSMMRYLTRIWQYKQAYEPTLDSEWSRFGVPETFEEAKTMWTSLVLLWEDEWISRTWVFPECILGPKTVVMYQGVAVSLDAILEFWETARKHSRPKALRHGPLADIFTRVMSSTTVLAISNLRKIRNDQPPEWQNTPQLLELLILSRHDKVTDPRDKVYALLGLADDSVARSIQQSYQPENSVLKVFTDVAHRYIEAGCPMMVIKSAGVHSQIDGLPSWVPDWTHQSRSNLNMLRSYNCTKDTLPTLELSVEDETKLQMRVARFTKIEFAGWAWRYYGPKAVEEPFVPIQLSETERMDFPKFTDEDARNAILTSALMLGPPHASAHGFYTEELETVIGRTLCADASWSGESLGASEDNLASFQRAYGAFRKFYARGPGDERNGPDAREHRSGIFSWMLECSEIEADKLMAELWPFAMAMSNALRGRQFALLEGGLLGVVPWDARKGDEVALVEGSDLPFVIRPKQVTVSRSANQNDIELVGDCYVHGVMDGELLVKMQGEEEVPEHSICRGRNGTRYGVKSVNRKGWIEWEEVTVH